MEGVACGYAFGRTQGILLKVRDARVLHCKGRIRDDAGELDGLSDRPRTFMRLQEGRLGIKLAGRKVPD